MLFNPKAQIRNTVGNGIYEITNALKRKVEAGIQAAFKAVNPKFERTTVFAIKPEYRAMAKGAFKDVIDTYKGYGRYNMDAKLGQGHIQAFKNKGIGKAINKISDLTGTALDLGDVIFGRHHYETALASFMQARGLKEITAEARAFAMERALEATFRAESETANAINELIRRGRKNRKGKNVLGGALSVVMPFVKTPINIAKESFDYSPLGMGKSIIIDTIRVAKGNMSATQYIHNLSKGLTGTAVSVLGFLLANGMLIPGVELTGAPPEDEREREFLYTQGWRPYSLKIGDTYYSISWAQPVATTMLMGVAIADIAGRNEDYQLIDAGIDLVGTLFDSVVDISPLAGLKDLFAYNESAADAFMGIGQDLLGQFVPSVMRQAAGTIDPAQYDVYTGDTLEEIKNQFATAVPGLGQAADVGQKVDAWGQPQEQSGDWFDRLLQNIFSPGNISTLSQDEVSTEIMRLYQSTGNNVLPVVFDKRELTTNDVKEIFGDEIKLTAKELQALKEGIGQSSRTAVEDYLNSEQYKNDDDEARSRIIGGIYSDIRALYRQAKAKGLDLSTVTDQVDVQSSKYFSGESEYESPVPDVSMLVPEYDYGVDSFAADEMFSLYKKTGDDSFILKPEETFDYNNKTFEYEQDPRPDIFEGYVDSAGQTYDGLNEIISSALFVTQTDKQKAKIIDDTVNDILNAIEKDTVKKVDPITALTQKEPTDTTMFERFNAPGWNEYSPDDKVISKLNEIEVYPKAIDSFSAKNELPQGTYKLSESDKKELANMTHKELLKQIDYLTADTAQQIIDDAYTAFKKSIIERIKRNG